MTQTKQPPANPARFTHAAELWRNVFHSFGGEASQDAEFLYVASIMADITPWALGDEGDWKAAATRMRARALTLKPHGFSPEEFEGRGKYGEYFAHHSRAPR